MNEKIIVCKDCGKEFIVTVGEQEFYIEKGFDLPKRTGAGLFLGRYPD